MTRLQKILTQLISSARREPGVPKSVHLSRGLHIEVAVLVTNHNRLRLFRKGRYPSDVEWNTVITAGADCDLIPTGLTFIRDEEGAYCVLTAFWQQAKPAEKQLHFFALTSRESEEAV